MNTNESSNNERVTLVQSVTSHIKLYALISLILEGILIAVAIKAEGQERIIIIIGCLVILTAVVVISGIKIKQDQGQGHHSSESGPVSSIDPLWNEDHLPVDSTHGDLWIGEWNCSWFYKNKKNQLAPYVDDTIKITSLDKKTGLIEGKGTSCYGPQEYIVKGRVSKKGIAHIFWLSPPPRFGMTGMAILSFKSDGSINGWWLGISRKSTEIGGNVVWARPNKNKDHKVLAYEASDI